MTLKRINKYSILIVISIFVFTSCVENTTISSCENFPKRNGEVKYHYVSGAMKLRFNLKNCQYEGKYFEYFENGNIKYKGNFNNGKRVSIWQAFNESSMLVKEWEYSLKGELHSLSFQDSLNLTLDRKSNDFVIVSNGVVLDSILLEKNEWNNINIEREYSNFIVESNNNFFVFDENLNLIFDISNFEGVDSINRTNKWVYELKDDSLKLGMFVFNEQKSISELITKHYRLNTESVVLK